MKAGVADLPGHLAVMMRRDRGRRLSALIAGLGNWDLAEEALAEAVESALRHWGRTGLPERAGRLAPAGRAAQGH